MQPLIEKKPQLKTFPSNKPFSLGFHDCRNIDQIIDKGRYRLITFVSIKHQMSLRVIDTIEEINNYINWAKDNIEQNKEDELWYKASPYKSWR